MLPIPFLKYMPRIFQKDPKAIKVANKVDSNLTAWKKDVLDMKRFHRPDEIRSGLLDDLGQQFRAGILGGDSDAIKRYKIKYAVRGHKKRGLFANDIKPILDRITGYSSKIVTGGTSADAIMIGLPAQAFDYWGSMGANGLDTNLGIDKSGTGDEIYQAGNVYINLHDGVTTPVLSLDTVKAVFANLSVYIRFAYIRLFLGYVDGSGNFVFYTGMQELTVPHVGQDSSTACYDGRLLWLNDRPSFNIRGIDLTGTPEYSQFIPNSYYNAKINYDIDENWFVFTGEFGGAGNPKIMFIIDVKNKVISAGIQDPSIYYYPRLINGFLYVVRGNLLKCAMPQLTGAIVADAQGPALGQFSMAVSCGDGSNVVLLVSYANTQILQIYDQNCNILRRVALTVHTGHTNPKRIEIYNRRVYIGGDSNVVVTVDIDTLDQTVTWLDSDEETSIITIDPFGRLIFANMTTNTLRMYSSGLQRILTSSTITTNNKFVRSDRWGIWCMDAGVIRKIYHQQHII